MKQVKVAVIQACPVLFDSEATIAKVKDLTSRAAKEGARIVLLPEAFVSGYPKGLDFGARIGSRTESGREMFRRYWESAIDVPSSDTEELGRIAREANVYLVIGVIERNSGTLYCTILFFAANGQLMGKHRKLMPTAMERIIWGFGDGSTMPVFDTPHGKIGAVICWENYMPLLRTHMYEKGIQIYCAPTVDDRENWLSSMRHIAVEGRCFVLSANQYLTRDDCPKHYERPKDLPPEAVLIKGGSCIIDPTGKILAGPHVKGPAILTAELDLDEITRGKYDLDVVGHYSRPDVFQLSVNETPQSAAVPFRQPKKDPTG